MNPRAQKEKDKQIYSESLLFFDFQTSLVDSTGIIYNFQHWIKCFWKKRDFHTWWLKSVNNKKQWSREPYWCNIAHIFSLINSYRILKVDTLMQKNKHDSQWLSVELSASLNEEITVRQSIEQGRNPVHYCWWVKVYFVSLLIKQLDPIST